MVMIKVKQVGPRFVDVNDGPIVNLGNRGSRSTELRCEFVQVSRGAKAGARQGKGFDTREFASIR